MPLSDHERRMLAEMEAAMAQEDPKLVSTLTGKARSRSSKRLSLGLALLFIGMATIVSGLIAKVTLVGIAGFGVALVGCLTILSFFSSKAGGALESVKGLAERGKGSGGWGKRMEDRWERRNFDN